MKINLKNSQYVFSSHNCETANFADYVGVDQTRFPARAKQKLDC